MSVFLSPNLPANVVEIGNEITQAKINEINAGTLALQTWVTTGFAPKASPTFTGVVTIPAGASISGYLTTATASSTYQTLSGMTSYLTTATASSTYQPLGSYLTDAPSDGSEYVRKNAAWSVATGGGGGLTISTLSNAATSTLNATAPTTGQSLTFDGTDLKWATVGGGGGGVAWGGITGTVTNQTDLVNYISGLGYLTTVPNPTANVRISGTYTLLSTDWNNCIVFTGQGNLNVPQNYVLATPIGTQIYVCNMNAMTSITGLTDSTETTVIYGTTSSISVGLHILIKTDTNEWFVS